MIKLIVTEFVSLDGVFEDPGGAEKFKYGGWTMPYVNEEFLKFKLEELRASDALLLGRITYEGFAVAWPKRGGDEFSDKFNSMPKYVVSTTLKKAEWNNSHIIKNNVVEEIKKLKEGKEYLPAGRQVVVHGSGTLARFLIEQGLVDELTLLVYPVVLGTGKRLFGDIHKTDLKLVESKPFSTGVVVLKYQPKS